MTPEKRDRYQRRIRASVVMDERGCWIWQKKRSRNGYGELGYGGGKNARAHRVSYEVFNGPIGERLDVCHRCDVRACVNPAHLFLGTRSDNLRDASAKNRTSRTHQKKGAAHPSAKLTDATVLSILARLKAGEPKARIARSVGVSDRVILLISRGEAWAHIPRAG